MSESNSKRPLNESDESEDEWVGPKQSENNQEENEETKNVVAESELDIEAKKREIKKRKSLFKETIKKCLFFQY